VIDLTPDAIPVMSTVDKISDFFIATGFSVYGFGIGPGAVDGGHGDGEVASS